MNKISKVLSFIVLGFIALTALCSCNTIADSYKDKGADFSGDVEISSISEKSLLKELAANKTSSEKEIIYVFFGSPKSGTCCTNIAQYEEQAQQYKVTKIYNLDCTDYDSATKRKEVQEKLDFADASVYGVMLVFVDGEISFDGTKTTTQSKYSTINKVSTYIFKTLPESLA